MPAALLSAILLTASLAYPANLEIEARTALEKANSYLQSITTNGGYLGIYSLDLQKRYGEGLYESASHGEIWIQPPGTPSVGQVLLRAYRATGDERYLNAARAAGLALAWGQRQAGGWDHKAEVSSLTPSSPPQKVKGHCTLDDRITQGALSFLMDLDDSIDEIWLSEAVDLGLRFLLQSQYPNGGWPQWYPLRGGYHDYYTFNDNTINDCIAVLLEAHRRYDREAFLQSARKGGEFILHSQLPAPQAGWAQQYDRDLQPAWARKYEPPAACSAVTARNIRTLLNLYLYTNDNRYLAPIPAAIDWLEHSQLAPEHWARFYELESNRPIYGDRDGRIHYDYDELSSERKKGYAWQGHFGVPEAVARYQTIKEAGSNTDPARIADSNAQGPSAALIARVEKIVQSQDQEGRWTSDMLYIHDFVRNMNVLCTYLEALAPH